MRSTIVVGLGGGGGWRALAWAMEEALTSGARLVLCHACRPDSVLASRGPTTPTGLLELAEPALARAVVTTRTRLGADRVTLRVLPGRPEHLLVDAAADADLVVIGPPTVSGSGDLGSTAHYVTAHASCPVVVVRTNPARPGGPFPGHVVVGVTDSAAGRVALEFAFGYADTHARPLAAVHAGADRCAEELAAWMRKYPTVAVQQQVHPDPPLPGLLRAATGAHLLVVGDHRDRTAVRVLPATVGDGALDRAACPVVVVPDWETRGGSSC